MPKPRIENSCVGKQAFKSKEDANKHIAHLNDISKKKMHSYKCNVCTHVHVGHECKRHKGLKPESRIKKMR